MRRGNKSIFIFSKKIESLYENFQKSQTVIDEIPNIVERLESLKVLHEESADLASSINNLSAVQNQISQSLSENNELLKKVNAC
jgi:dynactin-2